MNYKELQEQTKKMNGYSFCYKYRNSNKRLVTVSRVKDCAVRYAIVKEFNKKGMNVYKVERVTVLSYLKMQLLVKIGFICRIKANK